MIRIIMLSNDRNSSHRGDKLLSDLSLLVVNLNDYV